MLSSGWELQDVAKVTQPGPEVASEKFKAKQWYEATVPGTVLTTLVNNHVYPEPLYGENNRPETIPERFTVCNPESWLIGFGEVIAFNLGWSKPRKSFDSDDMLVE